MLESFEWLACILGRLNKGIWHCVQHISVHVEELGCAAWPNQSADVEDLIVIIIDALFSTRSLVKYPHSDACVHKYSQ